MPTPGSGKSFDFETEELPFKMTLPWEKNQRLPKNNPLQIAEMLCRGLSYYDLPQDYRESMSYEQHKLIENELKQLWRNRMPREKTAREWFEEEYNNKNWSQQDPNQPFSKKTTKYTSTPIPAVPTKILVQFIGGPFNTEQRYYDRLKNNWLKDREILQFPDEPIAAEITFDGDNLKATEVKMNHFPYLMQFLPQDQTQNFTDTQVAIAIFQ